METDYHKQRERLEDAMHNPEIVGATDQEIHEYFLGWANWPEEPGIRLSNGSSKSIASLIKYD